MSAPKGQNGAASLTFIPKITDDEKRSARLTVIEYAERGGFLPHAFEILEMLDLTKEHAHV